MISVEKLINSRNQLAKNGTSGYSTQEDDNSNIYEVQYDILALLCDNYENNQKVSDALINHVKSVDLTTDLNGVIAISESGTSASGSGNNDIDDYYRTLAVLLEGRYPATKINTNELGMYLTSPIRKPDLAKNKTCYYFANGDINMLPAEDMDVQLIYCRKPSEAKIVYTTSTDDDNDYLVVDEDETIDIEFPEGLFNLFLYKMVERLGISMKENLLIEYGRLGISVETKTEIQ